MIALARPFASAARPGFAFLAAWRTRRAEARAERSLDDLLGRLDPHLLDDIGLGGDIRPPPAADPGPSAETSGRPRLWP
jgi:uncharacterized protein YjiS (DUF1127 family)